jgi:hypothetical protein
LGRNRGEEGKWEERGERSFLGSAKEDVWGDMRKEEVVRS